MVSPAKYTLGGDRIRHQVYKAEDAADRMRADYSVVLRFPSGREVSPASFEQVVQGGRIYIEPHELPEWDKRIRAQVARVIGHGMARECWTKLVVGRGRRGGGHFKWATRTATVQRQQTFNSAGNFAGYKLDLTTVTHELAHGLDMVLANNAGHGPTFRAAHCVTWSFVFGTDALLRKAYEGAGLGVPSVVDLQVSTAYNAPYLAKLLEATS